MDTKNTQWTQNTIVDQLRTSTFVSDSRVRRNGMVLPLTLPLNVTAMWHLLSKSWQTHNTFDRQ